MGYTDATSGAYFYAAADPTGPMHEVLNKAAQAEHNASLADRARLDTVESTALTIHTILPEDFMTLGGGWTLEADQLQIIRRIGARIEFSLRMVRSVPLSHGNYAATVRSTWAPIPGTEWQLVAQQSGGGLNAGSIAALLSSDRRLITLNPNDVSTVLAVSGFYHTV